MPKGIEPSQLVDQSLYIEAFFEFTELSSGSHTSALPLFWEQFVVELPGGVPYLRIRLEASWINGNTLEGSIESNIYYITCAESETMLDEHKKNTNRHVLDKIRMIYVPAVRDPSKQLKNASGTMLYRIMESINWSKATKENIESKILELNGAISVEPGVSILKEAIKAHVFLDEFQDSTEIQYELVKTCFKDSDAKITAVGDIKQRIMVWAGALQTVFKDYIQDFHAVEIQLIMNHRSAPKLVAIQELMYESLKEVPIKIKCSSKWEENDGEVFLYKFSHYITEAKVIANDIKNRIDDGVKLNDICILTKQKPLEYTNKIIEELGEMGLRARVEVDFQDLLKEPITILVLHSLYLITQDKCPDSWEYVNDFIYGIYQNELKKDSVSFDKKIKQLHKLFKGHREDLRQCEDMIILDEVVHSILEFYDVATIKSMYPQYIQGTYFDDLVEKVISYIWVEYKATESEWRFTLLANILFARIRLCLVIWKNTKPIVNILM